MTVTTGTQKPKWSLWKAEGRRVEKSVLAAWVDEKIHHNEDGISDWLKV